MDNKELSIALKDILGKEDYGWLIGFTEKHKEKEIKDAVSAFQVERVSKLRAMSTEGYLFEVLKDQDFEKKLMQWGLDNQDATRLSLIVAKLRFEKVWLDKTSI